MKLTQYFLLVILTVAYTLAVEPSQVLQNITDKFQGEFEAERDKNRLIYYPHQYAVMYWGKASKVSEINFAQCDRIFRDEPRMDFSPREATEKGCPFAAALVKRKKKIAILKIVLLTRLRSARIR